jgi:NAD(P)-dependent dehydrogenase (short-subunit alcohol dehydrogenase family)
MTRPAVIITGGAKRVGAATALYFAEKGYDIALHYNSSANEAKALQSEIQKTGATCEIFTHDLSDISGLDALIKTIHAKMPHAHALINNASIFERCEFLETDEALFDRQFAINFKAPFFLTQSFAKTFGKNPSACVINILDTDIAQNQVSHFAYLLSKKTLADFTEMAAIALGKDIRVNGVCPGAMLPASESASCLAHYDKMGKIVPLKKHPSLDDLSEAIYWLTQQKSITGQIINVDGGKHVL